MTTAELGAVFAGLTREKLLARHRVHALGVTKGSEERGKLVEAISLQVAENPVVQRLVKKEFPKTYSITPKRIRGGRKDKPGRPKVSEEQKRAARRKASRVYRERRKADS